ncbi:MAG: hypothetical protein ABIH71_04050 [Candidatus Omnitrophota bacterium]|nr:hypothetical protein [Candidatus Omnitrophota bacterium]
MSRVSVLKFIKRLERSVFTTREISELSGKSLSAVTQALNFLQKQKVIFKIYRGVWSEVTSNPLSPYTIIPFLFSGQRVYVSFLSALHIYGIIEQIPQLIYLAAMAHTRIVRTKISDFSVHQITPYFFKGFSWYKGTGNFLIAEPEKALVDCVYLSVRKKNQFGYFPELYFPKTFSFKKAKLWVKKIPDAKIRLAVNRKLDKLKSSLSL